MMYFYTNGAFFFTSDIGEGDFLTHTIKVLLEFKLEIIGLQIKALFTGLDPLPLMGLLL